MASDADSLYKKHASDRLSDDQTHFGYTRVAKKDKAERVGEVFRSVASRYDVMNDVMSMGMHRLWKRATVASMGLRPGHHVLDVAGGSGDLTVLASKRIGAKGRVVLSDINPAMLQEGRDRIINEGLVDRVDVVEADAEALPFQDASFDRAVIAFGLRNVTDKEKALKSMLRVLKPGGHLTVLEFSKPVLPLLAKLYDVYSFSCLPRMGRWIAKDEASYRYLAESIRMHPDQATLLSMMQDAGFERCRYENMTGGIVALHQGWCL